MQLAGYFMLKQLIHIWYALFPTFYPISLRPLDYNL